MIIKNLKLRKIFSTNSKETIEVELTTNKTNVKSSAPIGTSVGKHEAISIAVENVIRNFPNIKRWILNKRFYSQEEFDELLKKIDGTENFSKMGGNLSIALSSAFLKAIAIENNQDVFEYLCKGKIKMPSPLANVVGAKGLKDIEEYLLFPKKQKSFLGSVEILSKVYLQIGVKLKEIDRNFNFGKDLESAWRCSLGSDKILEILRDFSNENNLSIGIDVASSELWDGKNYVYSNGNTFSEHQQLEFIENLVYKYNIKYLEDPFHEDDFNSFAKIKEKLKNVLVCGDDLLVTNINRLKIAIKNKSINAAIVKPNQIGTITDTIKFVKEAKKNNIATIMSHRSGETEDSLICHLAVGLNCDYVKFGISGERVIKINEMIRIEEKIQ
jgi:enolase